MQVSILGCPYEVEYRYKADDLGLLDCDGYCDTSTKRIVVKKYSEEDRKDPNSLGDLDAYKKKCTRHEIVHAFMYESGLSVNALDYEGAWARNEEMVDWFAIQGPKIYAAWKAADCL